MKTGAAIAIVFGLFAAGGSVFVFATAYGSAPEPAPVADPGVRVFLDAEKRATISYDKQVQVTFSICEGEDIVSRCPDGRTLASRGWCPGGQWPGRWPTECEVVE